MLFKVNAIALLVCLAHLCFANQSYEIIQGRSQAPRHWKVGNRAAQSLDISFRIHLRQCNLDMLTEMFWKVSDPDSAEYGNYMSVEEINDLVICKGDVERVEKWLHLFGITNAKRISNSIKASAPVSVLEKMLGTTFHEFEHTQTGHRFVRQMGGVSVPSHLTEVIEFISGISDFFYDTKFKPIFAKSKMGVYNPNILNVTDPLVTPLVLHKKYAIPMDATVSNSQNGLGIAAFSNVYDDMALCKFHEMFSIADVGPIDYQGPVTGDDQIESDLDIQYSTAIALGVNAVFDNHPPGEWILDWAQDTVENSANGPWVWSISYGWPEVYQCDTVDNLTITNCPTGYDYTQYIQATDTELMKLGLRGVTVVVASGDDGTPGYAANCPMDPKAPFAASSVVCADVLEDNNCQCGELTITAKVGGDTYTCMFPNGFIELSNDCFEILVEKVDNGVCATAVESMLRTRFYEDGQYCNTTFELTDSKLWFYSNCTCSAFTPITESSGDVSCTVQGYQYDPANGPAFDPDYPTASPYVTSVGAVTSQWNLDVCGSTTYLEEIYCVADEVSGFSGGGGFSSVNPMPKYQVAAVQAYLNNATLPPASTFNPNNRAYPDIAVNGHNFVTVAGISALYEGVYPCDGLNGILMTVSGTSAASPTFAGMVALINDWLLSNSLPTLGFLNPLLYKLAQSTPDVFNDIVPQDQTIMGKTFAEGTNTRCTTGYCCLFGFPIQQGWDAGTGLGTPNFSNLLGAVQSLHAKRTNA